MQAEKITFPAYNQTIPSVGGMVETPRGPKKAGWRPHKGPQARVLELAQYYHIDEFLYGGARGGGKTDAGFAWLTIPFTFLPPKKVSLYRALIIRRTSADLEDWMDRARVFYAYLGAQVVGRPGIIRFPNGALFRAGHLKDEAAYTKYIGHEYQRLLVEELTLIPRETDFERILTSNRSTIEGFVPQTFCTTNPGGPGHNWVMQRWRIEGKPPYGEIIRKERRTGKVRAFIPARLEDNPTLARVDPNYEMTLEGIQDEVLRAAWRWGDWSVFAGQFFTMFRQSVHELEPFEIPRNWQLWAGMDYGEVNPTVVGIYAKDEINNVTIRVAEYVRANSTASENARSLVQFIDTLDVLNGRKPERIYAPPDMYTKRRLDASSIRSPADIFKEYGFKLARVTDERVNGWRYMKELLAWQSDPDTGEVVQSPKFRYFKGYNDYFVETVPSLVSARRNPEDLEKCDIDHAADECRYALVGAAKKRFDMKEPLLISGI